MVCAQLYEGIPITILTLSNDSSFLHALSDKAEPFDLLKHFAPFIKFVWNRFSYPYTKKCKKLSKYTE